MWHLALDMAKFVATSSHSSQNLVACATPTAWPKMAAKSSAESHKFAMNWGVGRSRPQHVAKASGMPTFRMRHQTPSPSSQRDLEVEGDGWRDKRKLHPLDA